MSLIILCLLCVSGQTLPACGVHSLYQKSCSLRTALVSFHTYTEPRRQTSCVLAASEYSDSPTARGSLPHTSTQGREFLAAPDWLDLLTSFLRTATSSSVFTFLRRNDPKNGYRVCSGPTSAVLLLQRKQTRRWGPAWGEAGGWPRTCSEHPGKPLTTGAVLGAEVFSLTQNSMYRN